MCIERLRLNFVKLQLLSICPSVNTINISIVLILADLNPANKHVSSPSAIQSPPSWTTQWTAKRAICERRHASLVMTVTSTSSLSRTAEQENLHDICVSLGAPVSQFNFSLSCHVPLFVFCRRSHNELISYNSISFSQKLNKILKMQKSLCTAVSIINKSPLSNQINFWKYENLYVQQ